MRNIILITAAAAALTATATPGTAKAAAIIETPFNQTVHHADLDLTTPQGIDRLDQRVRTKIRRACINGGRDSVSIRLERECRDSAYSAATREMNVAIAAAEADQIRLADQSPAQTPLRTPAQPEG